MDKIEINNILSAGSIIRTKHPNTEWISNVVYRIYDNYIQIELTQDYINNLMLVGDKISLKFFGPETEFLLDGTIENIDIDKSRLITINVNKVNMFQNIRSYRRYDTYIISRITVNRKDQLFCIVTTVSSSGISVLSKLDFPLSSDAFVEVFVDSDNILRFEGEIVRKSVTENGYEFGIKFSNLDEENSSIVNNIISELKDKDNTLIKKYLSSVNS